jgi:hypothetical protein
MDHLPCDCAQCERLVMRTAHMLYRQLGLYEKTNEYSREHFQKTLELVRGVLRHMEEGI